MPVVPLVIDTLVAPQRAVLQILLISYTRVRIQRVHAVVIARQLQRQFLRFLWIFEKIRIRRVREFVFELIDDQFSHESVAQHVLLLGTSEQRITRSSRAL